MIILIDGYNLLKSVVNNTIVDGVVRKRFIVSLERYNKKKKFQIVVVFDGWPDELSGYDRSDGVEVIYAQGSADEWIKNKLIEYKNHEMLLVSSDRELCQAAQCMAVPSIGSLEFYSVVFKEKQCTQPINNYVIIKKSNKHDLPELDQLMYEMSQQIVKDADDNAAYNNTRQSKGVTLSKIERRLLHLLKKL